MSSSVRRAAEERRLLMGKGADLWGSLELVSQSLGHA
jgi:hypothetical protein